MSQLRVDHLDLAVVLDLALLTEDRSPSEERSLREVARRLDVQRNLLATGGQNDRVARPVRVVPCTYSEHHIGADRAAKKAGVERCRCSGDKVVPAFTAAAMTEPLVDPHGWSRARDAVDA